MKRILFLITILLLSLMLYPADSKQVTYLNNKLGLSFKYPSSWNVITSDEYIENISKNEKRKLTEDEINNIKRNLPLIGILKYKEPVDYFNPSITINLYPYLSEEGEISLIEISGRFLNYMKTTLKNLTIIEQAKENKLGNVNSVYSKFNHLVTINEKEHSLCTEIWFIHIGKIDTGGSFFIQIEANSLLNEETGSRKEIFEILDSIRIK